MPFYDIVAACPPDTTKKQLEHMLLNLLAERFHLRFHTGTEQLPGCTLVVDKDGSKLRKLRADFTLGCIARSRRFSGHFRFRNTGMACRRGSSSH